ncbi:MAG: exonuclease domain-containing protein [Propionibacteriaceae bacterium]|nr:exonuclease domain-containing protein [Propionibacteriaceae bacterium]
MTYGYAVIDTETTGLTVNNNRIIEIAAVGLRFDGSVEGEWSTLLNPDRDLGSADIHHISARDVLDAPHFFDIAGDLAEVLRDRVIVGHNVRFDAAFIEAEYRRAGFLDTLIPSESCLCTMRLSAQVLPKAPRNLEACCGQVGVVNEAAHSALADARATAALLQHLMPAFGGFATFGSQIDVGNRLASISLPSLPYRGVTCVHRGHATSHTVHYLNRLAERLPPVSGPDEHNTYLALLDSALIDRVLSAREADELVRLASDLGIDRATAIRLNTDYLNAVARVAKADGEVTDSEFADLVLVAELLGFGAESVRTALDQEWCHEREQDVAGRVPTTPPRSLSGFQLHPGDWVVFTGEMSRSREDLERIAVAAGLHPHPGVTKKVSVVVAADPDSLSTKARKAADYSIPIITESGFLKLLGHID